MDENLKKIQDFFKSDLCIKESIFDFTPSASTVNDADSRMKYVDDLYKELKIIKEKIKKINEDFHISNGNELEEFFSSIEEKIVNFNFKNRRYK